MKKKKLSLRNASDEVVIVVKALRTGLHYQYKVIAQALNDADYRSSTGDKLSDKHIKNFYYTVENLDNVRTVKEAKKVGRVLCTADGCTRERMKGNRFLCKFHYKRGGYNGEGD